MGSVPEIKMDGLIDWKHHRLLYPVTKSESRCLFDEVTIITAVYEPFSWHAVGLQIVLHSSERNSLSSLESDMATTPLRADLYDIT